MLPSNNKLFRIQLQRQVELGRNLRMTTNGLTLKALTTKMKSQMRRKAALQSNWPRFSSALWRLHDRSVVWTVQALGQALRRQHRPHLHHRLCLLLERHHRLRLCQDLQHPQHLLHHRHREALSQAHLQLVHHRVLVDCLERYKQAKGSRRRRPRIEVQLPLPGECCKLVRCVSSITRKLSGECTSR